jgi:hypothetical protein
VKRRINLAYGKLIWDRHVQLKDPEGRARSLFTQLLKTNTWPLARVALAELLHVSGEDGASEVLAPALGLPLNGWRVDAFAETHERGKWKGPDAKRIVAYLERARDAGYAQADRALRRR